MKHIGIFSTSGDVQTAIENGTLLNPYVAEVSGALDYNTVVPAPATMGTWSDDGQGVYTFQITETGTTYWEYPVKIGTLDGVYYQSETPIDMDVMLFYDDINWVVEYRAEGISDTPTYEFANGTPGMWLEESVLTEPAGSGAYLEVDWDGEDTFTFQRYADGSGQALSMTTINPEYPAGE